MNSAIELAERGWVPTPVVRVGIRRLLRERLAAERRRHADRERALRALLDDMARSQVALGPQEANRQHYEVPPAFFEVILGRHLKYSSGYWPEGVEALEQAEAAMLALTCQRAQLADGQRVLELGCGWGSLSLWMAERYPRARIVAVSNSALQGAHVRARARERGLGNLEVLTADMNVFAPEGAFDRVVSVEMFEHMRNWPELLRRVRGWLRPGGKLFVHVFAHREYAYPFELDGEADWMARHFFTGGLMPSHDLLPRAARGFVAEESWVVPGTHYARTAEAWYARLVARREAAERALAGAGPDPARQYHRWRLFLLACAELFAHDGGRAWVVSHHRLAPGSGEG